MTFKHISFSDSEIMRSFEKKAIEKGLVVPETKQIEKKASKIEVSKDFNSNFLTLCSELRKRGYEKYAKELENNFCILKKAETSLYNVSKETGEDLIDEAHPKGGVAITENAEGYIETIVEQHNKIKDIVNGKATGKLSNAEEIIKALKISLK